MIYQFAPAALLMGLAPNRVSAWEGPGDSAGEGAVRSDAHPSLTRGGFDADRLIRIATNLAHPASVLAIVESTPPGHSAPTTRPYVPLRTATEAFLADLWQGVLRVERVGAEDDFFELGGHSLLGMQVLSELRTANGVDFPLRALLQAPTVASVACAVDAAQRGFINQPALGDEIHASPRAPVAP
jgi:Phosphopantetheine attachment site